MAKVTSAFGVLLIVVGIMGYLWTRELQPAEFGVALLLCGVLADTTDRRRRMISLHIAVVLGFVAFAIPGYDAGRTLGHIHRYGGKIDWVQRQNFHEVVAVLCLLYVVICLCSFLLARRMRPVAAPAFAS